jgi:hypothetical protein
MQLLIQPPRSPISWGFNNPCFAERLPDPSQEGISGHPRPLASLYVWKLRLLNISETWNWPDIEQHTPLAQPPTWQTTHAFLITLLSRYCSAPQLPRRKNGKCKHAPCSLRLDLSWRTPAR